MAFIVDVWQMNFNLHFFVCVFRFHHAHKKLSQNAQIFTQYVVIFFNPLADLDVVGVGSRD